MHLKYVYPIIIFALGILVGQMSVGFFTVPNNITHIKNGTNEITNVLPLNKSGNTIDKNVSHHSDNSAILIKSKKERLPVISIEKSSQHDNDWQNILYETDDSNLKLAAISNLVSDDAPEKLAVGLGDTSPLIRQKTMLGLGLINSETSIRMVGQTLFSDHVTENRLVAISILERNFDMPFVEHLLTFTKNNDQDATVRQRAATSLGL